MKAGNVADSKQNLKVSGALSLVLLAGIAIILVSSWGFFAIAEDVLEQDPIVQFDQSLADAVHSRVTPLTIRLIQAATLAGNEIAVVLSLAVGLLFILRRRWQDLLLVVLAVAGTELLVPLIKLVVHRQRPIFTDPIQVLSDFSFPSGHAFLAVTFYGLMAYLVVRRMRSLAARVLVIVLALAIILLVGLTRIYLGVHFLSDVLGGYLGGLAWLIFTIIGVEAARRWRANSKQNH
jgi:undecaprenyl-diphosphatase